MRTSVSAALILAFCAVAARGEAPRIDALNPAQGPIAGGTLVTVSGTGFAAAAVTLDGTPVAPVALSDTRFEFTTPRRDNGYALLQVTTADGSAAAEYLYVPPRLDDLPPGYITTVAGAGRALRLGIPAKSADVRPMGVSTDANGNIYLGWPNVNQVLRVRADGVLEPFAGDGTYDNGPNGDGGPATAAWISFCRTVSLDAAGNAYIPDGRHRIRRVDANTGIITTIAGTGEPGFSGDGGAAKDARINNPNFLAAAPDGTVYFIDHGNARIRKITTDGNISTIAGTGVSGDSGDGGPAIQAQLEMRYADENGIAFDPRGFLYYVQYVSGKIRRIDLATGIITTFFAGRVPDIPFVKPWAMAVDPTGNVYASSEGRIVKLDPGGRVLATWGAGFGFSEDGTPIDQMRIGVPMGLALERDGNILFSDLARVRRINFNLGTLETVAGIAPAAEGVPGPAVGARLVTPTGDLAFLPSGDLLFGDATSIRIFRIDRTGRISIFGGTGISVGGNCDGRPIDACVIAPVALESDGAGGLFMSDGAEITYMESGGMTHRIVGPEPGYSGDGGPVRQARVTEPWDVALDRDGNVFIADTDNNRIRRIEAKTGIITTVAGGGPLNGFEGFGRGTYCGDGGPALDACFNTPFSVAVDPDGNIFVSDYYNFRIRKIDANGMISTFGNQGLHGRIVADAYGGLFVNSLRAIERYLPDGTSWVVAGTWEEGFSGDGGPATAARIAAIKDVAALAVDREGNLFFHDPSNARIRAVRFGAVLAPPDPQVQATRGGGQSAPLTRTFDAPLEVTVRTASGAAAPGVRVDFSAPARGASAVFSNYKNTYSTLTDRSGIAQAPFQASCQAGGYTVEATAIGSGKTVSFPLTNTSVASSCAPDTCVSLTPSQIDTSSPTTVQIDVAFPQGGLLGATASYNGQDVLQELLPYLTEVTSTSARVVIPNLTFPSGTNGVFMLTLTTTKGNPSACLQIQVP